MEKLKAYLELVRAHNLLATALGVIAGSMLVVKPLLVPALIAIITAVMIAAAGYAINDYFDIEIDKINKPERPIPSGRISPREALLLSYPLFFLAPLIALIVGIFTALFAAINSVLMYFYSRSLKRMGLIGNLVVAFSTAATLFYGALAQVEWIKEWKVLALIMPVVLMTFFLGLAREIVKGVEDYYGDKANNVRTLAVVWGPHKALKTALILTIVSIIMAIISFFTTPLSYLFLALTVSAGIASVISIAKAMKGKDPVSAAKVPRRVMKIAMFVGLIAIILDRSLSLALLGYKAEEA
ncbi:digeranylgeranylglyceryl phosphate synthase [Ignicoccus pacificus DSM 13166]|uniref:Digeranylgeranylglyceryl phosphate synthase n=1 Tax=Ignicoccus pacificus DSM 13166 TaxID=940294 RepID=A0A977K9P5_9CREN|nr:digeranylgeranylglyceryl phosphate synthase [Ignicoccus pacificus DSM 13166]